MTTDAIGGRQLHVPNEEARYSLPEIAPRARLQVLYAGVVSCVKTLASETSLDISGSARIVPVDEQATAN